MSGRLARLFAASTKHAVALVVLGLAVGVPVGVVASPSITVLFPPTQSNAPPAYPIWCSDPNPRSGWNYHVTYYTSNGTISSFDGGNGTGTPLPGPGQTFLTMDPSSYSNQTLIHSMFCYAQQGHTGGFAFHVNLATNEVVWG
jgi:hypothetical protein